MAYMTPRRRVAGLLVLAAAVTAGCNPLTGLFFLMPGAEPKQPAELMQFTSDDKNKEIKVVVFASTAVEMGTEFIRSDRELSNILARYLQQGWKDNKQKVAVISPRKVEKFKDEHPNWQTLGLADIGRHFEADYVIYLDIQQLGLYEKGSGKTMFRGSAEITVAVVDMNKPDDSPLMREYSRIYPSAGPVDANDKSLVQFRQQFMESIGRQLSWYFVEHPTRDLFEGRE